MYNLDLSLSVDLFVVLAKVREADNQFKRVLQVFPANLVLSNYILKSYLLKISNGALDYFSNEKKNRINVKELILSVTPLL